MELNSLKHVELLRKGLYAKQLQHYSNLCKIYEEILKTESRDIDLVSKEDAERVFEKYAPLLNAASKRDYSFLENNNLSKKEIYIFKNFAYHSAKMEQYKSADEHLKNVIDIDIKTNKPTLSKNNLEAFLEEMNKQLPCEIDDRYKPTFRQDSLENDKFLASQTSSRLLENAIGSKNSKLKYGHSPRWLGNFYFNTAKNALESIKSIDSSHIPAEFNISDTLTPANFGAEITGFKGFVKKFADKFKKKDNENSLENNSKKLDEYTPFTEREANYFNKKPGNLHEKIYNQVLKAKHGSLQKALAASLAIALGVSALAFSIPSFSQAHNFNSATKVQNPQVTEYITHMTTESLDKVIGDFGIQEYTNIIDFKEDANYALDAIEQTCQTYLHKNTLPTVDELKSILNNLDDVTSLLIEKPVELAYQEKYPDFSNFKADLYYDDTVTDYRDLNNKITEEGIKITATDPNGNQTTTKIPNIESPIGSTNLFQRALKQERSYDRDHHDIFEALSNPNAKNPKTGKPYTYSEKSDLCDQFLIDISEDCEIVRTLIAPNVTIDINPKGIFKYVISDPEKADITFVTQEGDIITTDTSSQTNEHINDDGPEL